MNIINSDTVPDLDTRKYSGIWHEVMKLPFKWEAGCVSSTAEYKKISDIKIKVLNTCYLDKTFYSRSGYAEVIDEYEPGKLRVVFDDGLPNDYVDKNTTNYWIHYLDYDKYSVVGTPTGKQVWLLSRSNTIYKSELDYFIRYIGLLGYDNTRLEIQNDIKII